MLATRPSRPHSICTRTGRAIDQKVLTAREVHRGGPDVLGPKVSVPARVVSRILRRHVLAYLRLCDPIADDVIRSLEATVARKQIKVGLLRPPLSRR